ncbi:MAG: radical SAM protein [Candidatus Gygaella obscura]|nr:radical SAM protein [Candidatus Gygaella obscura]
MKIKDTVLFIFYRIILCRISFLGIFRSNKPLVFSFGITCACQSNCKTCRIGFEYKRNPAKVKDQLSLIEIEKIFKRIGRVYFFNITGGEPYLREDIVEIVDLACKYLRPKIIHIPTNALLPQLIHDKTKAILKIIKDNGLDIVLTVKPSIDGIGSKHDEIRGVKGNFDKLLETIKLLKGFSEEFDNFHLELGTVISVFNIGELDKIEDFVHSLSIESYRNEIAENRSEFFNIGDYITPTAEEYQKLVAKFSCKIEKNICFKNRFTRMSEAFRLVYYDLAIRILKEKRQVIPCYAGISSIHLNFDGQLWPCCVLGYKKSFGNLRDYDYDFKKILNTKKSKSILNDIKKKNCYCPLANQSYANLLFHFPSLINIGFKIIKYCLFTPFKSRIRKE